MTHVQHILQTLEVLSPELQQAVADFADFLAQRRQVATTSSPTAHDLAMRRQQGFGRFKGQLEVPEDFDEPLDDFKEYM